MGAANRMAPVMVNAIRLGRAVVARIGRIDWS